MCKRINQKYFSGVWLAILIFPLCILGQDTIAAKTLPSVVTLTIQKPDGSTQTENGFLTIRDGIVATALHVLKDAKRVTARFSAGDEYECTGIIDKDEVRDVALLRIKVFGRPILKMTAVEMTVGAVFLLAAVRDSAFGLVPVSIAGSAANDGTKWVQLDGDIPAGNSGGPIIDDQGNVVGILTLKKVNASVVGYLISAGFILALDNSLPTRRWEQAPSPISVAPASISPGAAERMAGRQPQDKPNLSNDEADALIGSALRELIDNRTTYEIVSVLYPVILAAAPAQLYERQGSLNLAYGKLNDVRSADQSRMKITGSILPIIKAQFEASENLIKALAMANQAQTLQGGPWDLIMRSLAQEKMIAKMMKEISPDLATLEKDSPKFREFLPAEQRLALGLIPATSSGIMLNIINSVPNPFYLYYVYPGGLAEKIGLKRGDKIISVAGKTFTDTDCIEDLRMIIKQNLGKKLDTLVEREGKTITLKLVIPAVLPASANAQ